MEMTPPITIEEQLIIQTVNELASVGVECTDVISLKGDGTVLFKVKASVGQVNSVENWGNVTKIDGYGFAVNVYKKEGVAVICEYQ